jgi:hypothetical protein
MQGITRREFAFLSSKIVKELKPLEAQQGHITSQIADLIGHSNASHRGYWVRQEWRTDPKIPEKIKTQIRVIISNQKRLARIIQRKYAELDQVYQTPIVKRSAPKKKVLVKRRGK